MAIRRRFAKTFKIFSTEESFIQQCYHFYSLIRTNKGIEQGNCRYKRVNYADRKAGEPMTTKPPVGKSLCLKLDPATMQFGQGDPNFESESR
jgi:hypothetical protein